MIVEVPNTDLGTRGDIAHTSLVKSIVDKACDGGLQNVLPPLR
jgi:hypothetical protein